MDKELGAHEMKPGCPEDDEHVLLVPEKENRNTVSELSLPNKEACGDTYEEKDVCLTTGHSASFFDKSPVPHLIMPVSLTPSEKRIVHCPRPDIKAIYGNKPTIVAVLRENGIPTVFNNNCACCTLCFDGKQRLSKVYCVRAGQDITCQLAWKIYFSAKRGDCSEECKLKCVQHH